MLVVPQSLQSNENRNSATLARNVHTVPVSHHKVPKCPNIRNALAVVSNTRTNVNFEALTFKVSISDCSAVTGERRVQRTGKAPEHEGFTGRVHTRNFFNRRMRHKSRAASWIVERGSGVMSSRTSCAHPVGSENHHVHLRRPWLHVLCRALRKRSSKVMVD